MIHCALEAAGVEFIDENGGGPGVRLQKRQQRKSAKDLSGVRSIYTMSAASIRADRCMMSSTTIIDSGGF